MDNHTPTPWTFDEVWALIMGPDNVEVCAIHSGQSMHTKRVNRNVARDNAALILRAVNCHADLVRGCQTALAYLADPRSKFKENRDAAVEIIREALKKAESLPGTLR